VSEWKSASIAETFIRSHYREFAALLTPLVQCQPKISVAELNCSICEPATAMPVGYTTTVYQLPFASLNGANHSDLLRSVREYGDSLELDQHKGFVDSQAVWANAPGSSGDSPRTLYMISRWESIEAEAEAQSTHAHKTLLQPVIERADSTWRKYHVSWDMLLPEFVARWKDSESSQFPYEPNVQ
jgi:quinol monooxygenase YgiN